jgi:hypothetical protein
MCLTFSNQEAAHLCALQMKDWDLPIKQTKSVLFILPINRESISPCRFKYFSKIMEIYSNLNA